MTDKVQHLREFINKQLAVWKVPGASVTIVQGGEVLLVEGFGQRDRENALPVTDQTLFAIGSATKAFTTLALAMLVEEGKLDWDKPIRQFMPEFRLHDASASERATPRDLVSHRIGLPRHDLVWYSGNLPRKELVARLRYLEPNKDLREEFQYQNMMYMTAGYLVETLTGQTWEAFIQERIFKPLGMDHSNFSVDVSQKSADAALPYQEKKGVVTRMEFHNIDNVGPAGSINSTARDMLAWLRLQLTGKVDGKPLVSPGSLSQMHSPQTIIHSDLRWKELLYPSYGLGWFIEPYRGYAQIQHGGNIDGFSAVVAMLPQEQIGVVALANLNGSPLPGLIAFHAFDTLLGLDPMPWSERFMKDHLEVVAAMDKGKAVEAEARKPGHPPAHTLDEYTGEYEHPGYGVIRVEKEGDGLKAVYNDLTFKVEPFHYDIFEFEYKPLDIRVMATFTTDPKGNISELSAPLEPFVSDIIFTRRADSRMKNKAFLETLTGAYELMGMDLLITMKGDDQITATLPGQPAIELLPYEGLTFNFKALAGVSITFKQDEHGRITAVDLAQPGAVFTAKKK